MPNWRWMRQCRNDENKKTAGIEPTFQMSKKGKRPQWSKKDLAERTDHLYKRKKERRKNKMQDKVHYYAR